MTRYANFLPVCLCGLAGAISAAAQGGANPSREAADRWPGAYQGAQERIELTVSGGEYTGTLSAGGVTLQLSARKQGNALEGSFSFMGQSVPFTASLAGDTMTVVTQDGSRHTLERVAPAGASKPAVSAPAESGVVGEWRSPQGSVRFAADGSSVINGVQYRYQVRGNTLTITGQEGTFEAPFEVRGDNLSFTLSGQTVRLTRAQQEPRQPGSGGPAPSAGGSHPVELTGKWCYQANVNATNGGASSSSSCFVLNADGTYESSGLTDSYNPYGGATSESHDAGTWTATGNTLTANSRFKGPATYRLEKRNHPKTGDPLLILDGRAFVTYYQKAPWR